MEVDSVLDMDREKLQKALDAAQPNWEFRYATQQDLQTFGGRADKEAARAELRNQAFYSMHYAAWLLVRSARCVRRDQGVL